MESVGARIADVRREQRLTQQDVADDVGVNMRYIQAVERGAQNLTLESLAKFANALRVPVIEFFKPPIPRKRTPGRPPKT